MSFLKSKFPSFLLHQTCTYNKQSGNTWEAIAHHRLHTLLFYKVNIYKVN